MSLGPDSWCLPGSLPRHKLRAYGRIAGVSGGAEYRRLLNFLSKHASQGERELLNVTVVPNFAQVPQIVNRRIRSVAGDRLITRSETPSNLSQNSDFSPGPASTGSNSFNPTASAGWNTMNSVASNNSRPVQDDTQPMRELGEASPFGEPSNHGEVTLVGEVPPFVIPLAQQMREPSQRVGPLEANNLSFAPGSVELSITMSDVQMDFSVSDGPPISRGDSSFSQAAWPSAESDRRVTGRLRRALARAQRTADRQATYQRLCAAMEYESLCSDEYSSGFSPSADVPLSRLGEQRSPEELKKQIEQLNQLIPDQLLSPPISSEPSPPLHSDVPSEIVERVAGVQNEDSQFLGHLSTLLNQWFDKENLEAQEEPEPAPQGLETRRERTYAMLKKAAAEKLESKRLMERLSNVSEDADGLDDGGNSDGAGGSNLPGSSNSKATDDRAVEPNSSSRSGKPDSVTGSQDQNSRNKVRAESPSLPTSRWSGNSNQDNQNSSPQQHPNSQYSNSQDLNPRNRNSRRPQRLNASSSNMDRQHPNYAESRRRARNKDARHEGARQVSALPNGMRKEELGDGSYVLKDAVGRVTETRSHDGAIMSFTYDNRGHLKSFVRSDLSGKIHTTGLKDRHGVIVRDEHGSLRAQGDSMTVDSNGCVSIRKFDGQFWSLDVLRGIHIERRILEDAKGNWNCLTALLTCDGFRMVTRFQKLQENKRESYRKYGDWLGSLESSKFRFYGRDGSMIEFENDEDLEALRPSRIWVAGSRSVDREWVGRRQAGTAWDAVHRYISQYLSAL
jgi:YD repeat-containing protein